MKVKVTVELEEGTKATRTYILSTEYIFTLLRQDLVDRKSKHLITHVLSKALVKASSEAASMAANDIVRNFNDHYRVFQYDDENGDRQIYPIKDINEFNKFKKELDKQ